MAGHSICGKQKADKTWGRVAVEDASQQLLGVLANRDAFEFRYQATLPTITGTARAWIPVAQSDDFQQVRVKSIRAPGTQRMLKENACGNTVLFLELVADAAKARDLAGEANDPESQDLMIARITLHQKTIWMLRSFLHPA